MNGPKYARGAVVYIYIYTYRHVNSIVDTVVCIIYMYSIYILYSGVFIYTHTHTRVNENRVKVSAAEAVEGKHGPYYGEVMRSEAERRVGGSEGGTRRRTLPDGRAWRARG